MSIKSSLVVDQGANFIYNVYLIDADGNPFDVTGYYGNAQIRKTFTSTSYTTVDVSIDANVGLIILSMNATTTANLTSTRYVYDLNLTQNTTPYVTSRILEGIVTVNPKVTR
jgi:hypothetical protein